MRSFNKDKLYHHRWMSCDFKTNHAFAVDDGEILFTFTSLCDKHFSTLDRSVPNSNHCLVCLKLLPKMEAEMRIFYLKGHIEMLIRDRDMAIHGLDRDYKELVETIDYNNKLSNRLETLK